MKAISLSGNNIKVIHDNLFSANPALGVVALGSNPITNVGFGAFNNLKKLTALYFYETTCIAEKFSVARAKDVPSMVKRIKMNCPNIENYGVAAKRNRRAQEIDCSERCHNRESQNSS